MRFFLKLIKGQLSRQRDGKRYISVSLGDIKQTLSTLSSWFLIDEGILRHAGFGNIIAKVWKEMLILFV